MKALANRINRLEEMVERVERMQKRVAERTTGKENPFDDPKWRANFERISLEVDLTDAKRHPPAPEILEAIYLGRVDYKGYSSHRMVLQR